MIVYRIWNARDDSRGLVGDANGAQRARMTPLDSVIRIVIDSGLGYTLVSLTLFFSQVARSNALYITSGAVSLYTYIDYVYEHDPNTWLKGYPGGRNCIQPD